MSRPKKGALAFAAALVVSTIATSSPAVAGHGGSYSILRSNGTFVPAGPTNLWRTGIDDDVRQITFPFAVRIYGHLRTTAYVSSNGNLQFGPFPSAKWTNPCLPDGQLSGPVIAVYYDDILIRPNETSGDGVLTRVVGTAPNRRFVIVWRGVEFSNPDEPVRAEVIFYEGGRQFFDTVYAAGSGERATVGIQNFEGTSWNQRTCNSGTVAIRANDQFRFSFIAP